ncbi:MAG: alpha-L-arabinofuranosidase C-terminal domain-containing protein, partial [Chloroflexota bacterium]|nr:alpha-L-arabinofuranosidase C-terminal domain-containing protein [Chloroflexota bacterium]
RHILGHFIEHFHTQIYGGIYDPGSARADECGFRQDVIEALKELHVPIVRWPGGNFVSDYHWYEAVGHERVPSYNKAWRVEEPNVFGTDEFIAWCKAVGCEPYVCTNGGNGTAEEMSNWVEYCNGQRDTRFARMRRANGSDDPFAVKFWGIGNESYGDWQIGAKTVDEWGPYVAESAKMMRAVDEDIVLSAAAVPDTDWTLRLLQAAGRYLDLVSIHGYWDVIHQVDAPADYLTCMMQSESPGEMIQQTRSVIAAAGLAGKVKIAFDEWNLRGWHHPDGTRQEVIDARERNDIASTYTMADAVFSAGFLNACLRNADIVSMANMAPAVNARGPLFVHPDGIVKRTTFHVLRMYGDLLRENVVASSVKTSSLRHDGESVAVVDAIVTGDDQGSTVVLVNRHPTEVAHCTVTLDGARLDGDVQAEILDGPSADSYNSIEQPDVVAPRKEDWGAKGGDFPVPPHSVCILSFPS